MKIDQLSIAAVVVLYNPEDNVIENINSYIDHVDIVYAVDNSELKNELLIKVFQKNSKIEYIDNGGNRGIAHALNVGAKKAVEFGYRFLLTMDQDSMASNNMILSMLKCLKEYSYNEVGIMSPFHASKFNAFSQEKGCIEKKIVMTSGNLLSVDAYQKVGPFYEELFLDYVDNEYCLRLQKSGYKVVQASAATLIHNLGNLSMHSFFGKKIYCYNYPPIRYYYRTRNVIVLSKKYNPIRHKELLKDFIKIIIFENNKIEKIRYIYLGILDAFRGQMGKFNG